MRSKIDCIAALKTSDRVVHIEFNKNHKFHIDYVNATAGTAGG